MTSSSKLNIVVVGAGGMGALTARSLSAKLDASKYDLILLDSRPYRIILPAAIRMVVSEESHLEDSALVPIDKRLFHNGNGQFMNDSVQSIVKSGEKGGQLVLGSGKTLPYHVLVLAPGSKWEGPLDFPDDPQMFTSALKDFRLKIEKADRIVLVGGGAVGIEFAGEIKDLWPKKNVTIIHGDKNLLNKSYPDKFRMSMERNIKARGVEILFGEFIDDIPESGSMAMTRSGKKIEGDLFIQCRGGRPNTNFIKSLGEDVLTDKGLIRVRPTLQTIEHPEIFTGGDVIDWSEQKQAVKAQAHSSLVAANIIAYLDNKPLKDYKGSPEIIIITNGKNDGQFYLGVLWGITLGGWFARMLKSKTLLVPQLRKGMGY